jgi:peptide/nickel transport system substrate-binding protein
MAIQIPRRTLLKAVPAAAGASILGFSWSRVAHAARDQVIVRIDQDIQNLDPANRIGTEEGNIIRAVFRRLIKFKPGVLEWELDAAESIEQTSDTVIDFTLKPGLMFHAGYGELTAEDVKFSYERFNPPEGEKASYSGDWEALDHVEVTGAGAVADRPARCLRCHRLPPRLRGAGRRRAHQGDRRRPLLVCRMGPQPAHRAARR